MIIHGDCLETLKTLEDNSIDAVVTDPPYGLSFMNRKWDYDVPSTEIWEECLRVLKPGGYLLAFAGTRTQHRMAVRIEDAGFEIRDMIAWVYGSGFPKSLDISKAIDKNNGEVGRLHRFTAFMRTTGLTAKQINEATGTFMGSHYLTDKSQPAIPTVTLWRLLRPLCGEIPAWVDELIERIEADREVVGSKKSGIGTAFGDGEWASGQAEDVDITAPATEAAKQWEGWGTALKPALEPITVARKPLIGTVAENVLTYGTGGLNIDQCRVGTEDIATNHTTRPAGDHLVGYAKATGEQSIHTGRFPANLIHDGSDEVVELFPNNSQRFFYCAKASKKERNLGCEELEEKELKGMNASPRENHGEVRDVSFHKNNHPTVKPIALMEYLVKLVSRDGATVLDPFAGSGTTGIACKNLNRQFIGIEREADYVKIANARINAKV